MPRLHGVLVATLACALLAHCAVQRPAGGAGPLKVGDQVPALSATDHEGHRLELRALSMPALVYFYPKDGTPGCTKEACALRDAWDRYTKAGVKVIGVSADSRESHREFAKEHNLPFSLVADPDHVWSTAFGVGTFLGMTKRRSFLLNPKGEVAKIYLDVDPGVHATEVLNDARRLGLTVK